MWGAKSTWIKNPTTKKSKFEHPSKIFSPACMLHSKCWSRPIQQQLMCHYPLVEAFYILFLFPEKLELWRIWPKRRNWSPILESWAVPCQQAQWVLKLANKTGQPLLVPFQILIECYRITTTALHIRLAKQFSLYFSLFSIKK